MNNISTTISSHEVFKQAVDKFDGLVAHLQSSERQNVTHGEIEAQIQVEGTEVLRSLLQAALDLRTINEEKQAIIIDETGDIRTHRRMNCSRKLMTVFGQVNVNRIGYSGRGKSRVHPMDKALNLPTHKYSDGLCKLVIHEVSQHAFDEGVKSIDRQTGGHIGKRQIEALTVEMSQDFESFYSHSDASAQETQALPPAPPIEQNKDDVAVASPQEEEAMAQADKSNSETTAPLLILTTDAKGIVMHNQDLREETKKAAARQSNKLKTRLSPGEKKNRKRMATVASVYEVERYHRSARSIMGLETRDKKRPKIKHKRVWASVEQSAKQVTESLFMEAKHRQSDAKRECVVLVDGDNNQFDRIQAQMEALGMSGTIIIDFIHVLEYLWKASYCFHEAGSEEAESWVQEKALALLEGKVSQVAAGMRRSATLRKLEKAKRKAVDNCAHYILKRKKYLLYDQYLEKGYPIATGVIEGACRHLIKDRMDITGARWRLKGAEAVLKLRSIRSSGDMESYFEFHKKQSMARNYGYFAPANNSEFDLEKLAA